MQIELHSEINFNQITLKTKNMKLKIMKNSKILIPVLIILMMAGCAPKIDHSATIKEALSVMKESAAKMGEASVHNDSLFFGTTPLNNNFELVDALQAQFACTATFFIKSGERFIRISTDVIQDGHRALGTELDPKGPVIGLIKEGKSFYGTVDILGNQYETGYEPIQNAEGEVIGIYYIGFQIK